MIRISVTDLESWRYWRKNDESSLVDLLVDLHHESEPTIEMQAGKALHRFLENVDLPAEWDAIEQDGFNFVFDLDARISIPAIRELKGETRLDSASGPVTLVGVVDGMDRAIHDYKLTASFNAEKYLDSYQWRAYLLMFGATQFIYDVFVGGLRDDGAWHITEYHRLPMFAYPGMERNVQKAVDAVAAIIAEHLPERVLPDPLPEFANGRLLDAPLKPANTRMDPAPSGRR